MDQHYLTMKRTSDSNVLDNCKGTVLRRANSESPSAATAHRKSLPSMSSRESPGKKIHDIVRPASAISEITAHKMESPKRVVIGEVITASRTSSPVSVACEKRNGILKKDSSGSSGGGGGGSGVGFGVVGGLSTGDRAHPTLNRCVSMDAERSQQHDLSPPPPPPPPSTTSDLYPTSASCQKKSHLTVDTTLAPGGGVGAGGNASRHTSSSESPEWPSPPEPLTPQTPTTPLGMEFDSDTIKRLLRSLPSSPIEECDLGFHDDPNLSRQGQGRRSSQLARTKSLNTHDRVPVKGANSVRGRQTHVVVGPVVCKAGEVHRSKMFNKVMVYVCLWGGWMGGVIIMLVYLCVRVDLCARVSTCVCE